MPVGRDSLLHLIDIISEQIDVAPDSPLPTTVADDVPIIKRELDAALALVPQVGSANAGYAAPAMVALLLAVSMRLKPSLAWSEIPAKGKIPEALLKRARELDVALEGLERDTVALTEKTSVAQSVLNSVEGAVSAAREFAKELETLNGNTKESAASVKEAADAANASLDRVTATLKTATETEAVLAASAEKTNAAAVQVAENSAKISSAVGQATAHADSTAKAEQRATTAAEEATKLREKTSSENEQVSKILAQASASGADIAARQTDVSKIADSVKSTTSETQALKERAETGAKEAESLSTKALEAYRIITTAGLAGAFNQRAASLTKLSIYWSFALMFALVAAAIIGSYRTAEMSSLLTAGKTDPYVLFIQLVLSVLTVGAPVWLAWLATKQISHIFRLAEDYGYKASVAKAYEGFKEEAVKIDKQFEARLFASALERFNENPIRLISDTQPGSPLNEFLQQPAIQKLMDTVPAFKETVVSVLRGAVSKSAEGKTSTKGDSGAAQ
jgi:hypothetical protein